MVWVAKRINLLVCYIMITREQYLGRPMSIMSLPTPQGRRKTQAKHTCFLGILSSIIDRQDKDISTQNNVTNLRQCTALLSCLGQDERWGAKNDWKVSSSRIMNYSGLDKLWYPISIRDTSTWSKSGAHGEHGDVFLFSNLGALWFSENLIRYSLHVCLREVKNNLFSFKHSYLRHFLWRF